MKWLKNWLLKGVKKALLNEVAKFYKYEPVLVELIRQNVKPDKQAKAVVDYVQDLLRKIIEKNL